jgi:hypothetical protein
MNITLTEEVARWARCKAADGNASVSELVGRMLADEMRRSDEYWKAYETWKKIDASKRLTRSELRVVNPFRTEPNGIGQH